MGPQCMRQLFAIVVVPRADQGASTGQSTTNIKAIKYHTVIRHERNLWMSSHTLDHTGNATRNGTSIPKASTTAEGTENGSYTVGTKGAK
jgi:hypothetical protein